MLQNPNRQKPVYLRAKFSVVVALFISTILIGALFYSRVEGLTLVDSFYFSVVTLTTVGYGDFTPQTDAGKIFTIFYILIGIGIIMAFIDIFSDYMIEKRTTKKINDMNNNNKK